MVAVGLNVAEGRVEDCSGKESRYIPRGVNPCKKKQAVHPHPVQPWRMVPCAIGKWHYISMYQ